MFFNGEEKKLLKDYSSFINERDMWMQFAAIWNENEFIGKSIDTMFVSVCHQVYLYNLLMSIFLFVLNVWAVKKNTT